MMPVGFSLFSARHPQGSVLSYFFGLPIQFVTITSTMKFATLAPFFFNALFWTQVHSFHSYGLIDFPEYHVVFVEESPGAPSTNGGLVAIVNSMATENLTSTWNNTNCSGAIIDAEEIIATNGTTTAAAHLSIFSGTTPGFCSVNLQVCEGDYCESKDSMVSIGQQQGSVPSSRNHLSLFTHIIPSPPLYSLPLGNHC
jgi:hypothetical protein